MLGYVTFSSTHRHICQNDENSNQIQKFDSSFQNDANSNPMQKFDSNPIQTFDEEFSCQNDENANPMQKFDSNPIQKSDNLIAIQY